MFGARPLPRTLDAALRDLGSEKASVRVSSVRDLARHGETDRARVIEGLERALKDADAGVRAAAATGLADIDAHEATAALLEASQDEDAQVQQMAIAALGEAGDERATERLEEALTDRRPEVRFQATIGYARLADREKGIVAMLARTRDDDAFVCHIALRMAEEVCEASRTKGERALDPRVLARAEALLEHGPPMARVAAAVILARNGDSDASPSKVAGVLVALAKGEIATTDAGDEAAAIELCGDLQLRDATKALERRAFGGTLGFNKDRCAWHARVSLARMGHERATREILAELRSWDRDRRTLAVAAAGRARLRDALPVLRAMKKDEERADPDAVKEALALLESA